MHSELGTLREDSLRDSRSSFSFFVRRFRGLRMLPAERCLALQEGAKPQSKLEQRLLDEWNAIREEPAA